MDLNIRLDGLTRLLTAIYGEPSDLPSMLDALGFDTAQSRMLREDCLASIAAQLVDALRDKLSSGERDLWFRLLSRRYGLDGEPPASLEECARLLDLDPDYAPQAEADALQKCRYKATQEGLRRELRRIALAELSKGGAGPQKQQIIGKLNRLADLHAALDLTRMDYEGKRTEVLKNVQAELDALESEYQPVLDAAQDNLSALEEEIKLDVLLGGETVKTDLYQAVYMKGRIMWDNNGMNDYAKAHPDVLKFRRVGQPAVALRQVGKSED